MTMVAITINDSLLLCHNRWAYCSINWGLCLWDEEGGYFHRNPLERRSIRLVEVILYAADGGPRVRCWVILCVAVIRWELDALLNCLGACLQGMSSYDAAWGAENAWTATNRSTLPSKTLPTATDTAPICVEQLINPFRLSHILFQPHWAAPWSVEYQPSMSTGSTLMRSEKTDLMEALPQFLWPVSLNSAGVLFAFRSVIVLLGCDLRPGAWIYWPTHVKTLIF